jgi:hypothetical protein
MKACVTASGPMRFTSIWRRIADGSRNSTGADARFIDEPYESNLSQSLPHLPRGLGDGPGVGHVNYERTKTRRCDLSQRFAISRLTHTGKHSISAPVKVERTFPADIGRSPGDNDATPCNARYLTINGYNSSPTLQ